MKLFRTLLRSFTVCCMLQTLSLGQVPELINYQGRLADDIGLLNGVKEVVFDLFTAESVGSVVYSETQTVDVVDGLVNAYIGASNTVTGALFGTLTNGTLFLQISIEGSPLLPRQRIASVAYAGMAAGVGDDAITEDMIRDGAVRSTHLADGAVTTAKIGAQAVGADQLAAGAVGGDQLGDGSVSTRHLAEGSVTAGKLRGDSSVMSAVVVTNPTPAAADWFGYAVAAMGDERFVVGVPYDGAAASRSGVAHIFDANGAFVLSVTNPTPAADDHFGSAVAGIGENRFAVGAPDADLAALNGGAAYLYDDGGALMMTITNPSPDSGDRFGCAVAGVGGDRLLIGAYGDDTGAQGAGIAYLFDDASGVLLATITNPIPASGEFGRALAAVGDEYFVVAAAYQNTGAGAVHLYRSDGTYALTVTNPAPADYDFFGKTVAGLGDDRFVVGAYGDDTGGSGSGMAYLYATDGTLLQTIANPTPADGDGFGFAVAGVGHSKFAVCARGDDAGASGAGAAHLFDADGAYLITLGNPTPDQDDNFGQAAAGTAGGLLAVSANMDDAGAPDSGVLYLFAFGSTLDGLVIRSEHIEAGAVQGHNLAAGAVGTGHIATGAVQTAHIGAGAVGSDQLAADAVHNAHIAAGAVDTDQLADGGVTALKLHGDPVVASSVTVTNPTPNRGANFGYRAAWSGDDRLAVGAPYDDAGGWDAGAVHVFANDGSFLATLANPSPEMDDNFGHGLAAAGDDLFVVGAPYESAAADRTGEAYIFRSDGTLIRIVTNPAPSEEDRFGMAVARVGADRFIVGAPRESPDGLWGVGAAYVYRNDGTLLLTVTNPTPSSSETFGAAVAGLDDGSFIVGAPEDGLGAAGAGTVYLYAADGTLKATVPNPTPTPYEHFGCAVAGVGGGRFVVGAMQDSSGMEGPGEAYLYDGDGTLLVTLANPTPDMMDRFGGSVAAVGEDLFLIGALGEGTVHLYRTDGTRLATLANPVPGWGGGFGDGLAGCAGKLAVGASSGDASGSDGGVAYIYGLGTVMDGLVIRSENLDDGAVQASDIAAGAVGPAQLATGAVQSVHIAANAIQQTHIGNGAIGSGQLATGAVQTAHIATGAVGTDQLASGSVTASRLAGVSATQWYLMVTNPTPESDDHFGEAVAMAGDGRWAVGVPSDRVGTVRVGTVHIFNDAGELLTTVTNPIPQSGDEFGETLAAIGDDIFAIGNPTAGALDEGLVHLYRSDGSLLVTISNQQIVTTERFGSALAAVGADRLVIGAPDKAVEGFSSAGGAYFCGIDGMLLAAVTNPTPAHMDKFGDAVAGLPDGRFMVGAPRDDTAAEDAGAVYIYSPNGTLLASILSPDSDEGSRFGRSVAAVGDRHFVIGAPSADGVVAGAGRVYVFDADGALHRAIDYPEPRGGESFGVSIAALGPERFIVGASVAKDEGYVRAGKAYLYDLNGTLLATFSKPQSSHNQFFGGAIGGRGEYFVAGAPYDDTGEWESGVAYLFKLGTVMDGLVVRAGNLDAGAVTADAIAAGAVVSEHIATGAVGAAQVADGSLTARELDGEHEPTVLSSVRIPNPTPETVRRFGTSVAPLGDGRIAVGASYAQVGEDYGVGTAFIFEPDGTLVATLQNPDPDAQDYFGKSVAALGADRLIVTALYGDSGAGNAGEAYIYRSNGDLLAVVTNPAVRTGDRFGRSAASFAADRFVIGADFADVGAPQSGVAHVFNADGTLLHTLTNPTPQSNDWFGLTVAGLDDGSVIVGAPGDDQDAVDGGTVYLFAQNGTLKATIPNPTPANGDWFGYTVAGVGGDRFVVGASKDDGLGWGVGAAYLYDTNGTLLATIPGPTPDDHEEFGYEVAAVGTDLFLVGERGDGPGSAPLGSVHLYRAVDGTYVTTVENPNPVTSRRFGEVAGGREGCFAVGVSDDDTVTNDAGVVYVYQMGKIVQGLAVRAENLAVGAVTGAAIADGTITVDDVGGAMVAASYLSITNPTPEEGDSFGDEVVAVGDEGFVIAAYYDGAGQDGSGAVHLYDPEGTFLRTLINPSVDEDDAFGFSVAAVGSDSFVVGAPFDDTGAGNAGRAYLFRFDGTLLRTLSNLAPSGNDVFGYSAARVGNDRFVIGAPGKDVGATDAGAAYMYRSDGTFLTTIQNPRPGVEDQFGTRVAGVGTNWFVIAASDETVGTVTNAGAVHLFRTDGSYVLSIDNPSPERGDYFGYSVAGVGDDLFAVGQPEVGRSGSPGEIYIYRTDGTLLRTVTDPHPLSTRLFGCSVAAAGSDRFLTSSAELGAKGSTVYLFNSDGVVLAAIRSPRWGASDGFGIPVLMGSPFAMLGNDRLVAGAYYSSHDGIAQVGMAYLFSLGTRMEGLVADSVGYAAVSVAHLDTASVDDRYVNRGGDKMYGALGIGREATANELEVSGNASKSTAGDWLANSDASIKTDVQTIEDGMAVIDRLRPVRFRYTEDYRRLHPAIENREYCNFIAQEFRQVFPESVQDDGTGLLQIDAYNVRPYLVRAMQELIEENRELKARLTELETRLNQIAPPPQTDPADLPEGGAE